MSTTFSIVFSSPTFAQYKFGQSIVVNEATSAYARHTTGYVFSASSPDIATNTYQAPEGWVISAYKAINDEGFGPAACTVRVTQRGGTYFSDTNNSSSSNSDTNANVNILGRGGSGQLSNSSANSQNTSIRLKASFTTLELKAIAYQRYSAGTKANCKLKVRLVCTQNICW